MAKFRKPKQLNTPREFNRFLDDGKNGYVLYRGRKLMVCKTQSTISDPNKRKMDIWYQRREEYAAKGLCHMCGKYKISSESKSRCKKCVERFRAYERKRKKQ